jgi:exosortase
MLAAIWVPVVYLLGAQWSLYQQYNYGWAVPLLCLYLAWERRSLSRSPSLPSYRARAACLLIGCGLLLWITRILQEANPIWRAASCGLAIEAIAITLLLLYLTGGMGRVRRFAFPIVFFLVAVPWPTPVESAVIQNLTRLDTSVVVELLNALGIPALASGNIIEVGAGAVGIDEACSGIRSVQATLMISLFFGGLYRLTVLRRIGLCLAGLASALLFNFGRMFLLTWIAAREGTKAIEGWHDPAGVTILVACFLCIWATGVWLQKQGAGSGVRPGVSGQWPEVSSQKLAAEPTSDLRPPISIPHPSTPSALWRLAMAVVAWVVVVEVSTEVWFRSHEARDSKTVSWSVQWPEANSSFKSRPLSPAVSSILAYDAGTAGVWSDDDGTGWQAFYFRWLPARSFYGRMRVALAKTHSPEICLSASGLALRKQLEPAKLQVQPGLTLAFRRYLFDAGGRPLHVFFAAVEDLDATGGDAFLRMTHLERVQAALAGSRNFGQRNFEVAISGIATPEEALRVFAARLPQLVQVGDAVTNNMLPSVRPTGSKSK